MPTLTDMLEFCAQYRMTHPNANNEEVGHALAEHNREIESKGKTGGVNSVRTE